MTSPSALVLSSMPGRGLDGVLLKAHVRALRAARIREIAIVQPPHEFQHEGLGNAQVILQPSAWNDPFDALVLGIFALNPKALVVLPCEHEFVSPVALSRLIAESAHPGDSFAVVPLHRQRRGYPVVLFRPGIEAIVREAASPNGLRYLDALLSKWGPAVRVAPMAEDAMTCESVARA